MKIDLIVYVIEGRLRGNSENICQVESELRRRKAQDGRKRKSKQYPGRFYN